MNVPSNITVLLVESRSFYRDLFVQSLGKLGLRGRCILSKDYKDSLAKLATIESNGEKLDLIIIEAELSQQEEGGLKLVELIRSKSTWESTAVLMVSAEDDAHKVVKAFEKGVDSYAFKPIDEDALAEKIEFCWRKRKNLGKAS
jgi:DNA-binding response OmpR family regulator